MSGPRHYVPILKGKPAEFGALQNLDSDIREGLTPLVDLMPIPWDYDNDGPQKTLDEHIKDVGSKVATCWGTDRLAFVDVSLLADSGPTSEGSHPLTEVFKQGRAAGAKLVPVTGLSRDGSYQEAVKAAAVEDGRGICIRLTIEDFKSAEETKRSLDDLMGIVGTSPSQTDMVVDLGDIQPGQVNTSMLAALTVLKNLPFLSAWRSLTLAGTSFPKNLSGVKAGMSTIPRHEWALWQKVLLQSGVLPRVPSFGDYGVSSQEFVEMDPRIMDPSANIRYTIDSQWLIPKGGSLRKSVEGFAQYRDLSRELVRRPEFCGAAFSWGDRFISECAAGKAGTGNATTWRQVGTSHHLTFVVRQIASLP